MKRVYPLMMIFGIYAFTAFGQAYPDRHNTSWTSAWMSCEESASPNVKRDNGHWIMYDFGDQYSMHGSTIWNFNVPDSTSKGVRDVVIDFSDDGETWTELGEFTIPQAPGSAFYEGHSGPDFDGTVARYVLISVINTHGDPDCAALSELRINATITTSTNIPDGLLPIDVVASPNPASEYAIISISNNQSIDLKYTLVDMSGRLLRQGLISDNSFRLNTSNLTSGTYTVNIYNEEGSKSVLINVVK